jgi:ArsR family transcriptional regulator, lead/cadmium/zinc/bismuth-responsive transcriptional repressor
MSNRRATLLEEDGCQVRVIHPERLEQAREEALSDGELLRLSAVFKVLGDPTRLRMLRALSSAEMCVCDLAALAGTSDSAVSHQLRRLKDLGLVSRRRDGAVLFYSLDDAHVTELLDVAVAHARE